MISTWVAAAALALSACAVEKTDPTDDFSDLAQLDGKSDAFSYRLRLLGALEDNAQRNVLYTPTPRFRGWTFTADEGDRVSLWLRSSKGDPVTWLLDGRFRVLARSDDSEVEEGTSTDSAISYRIGAPATADHTFYVVFRDYWLERHRFALEFHLDRGGGGELLPQVQAWLTERLTAGGYDYTTDTDYAIDGAGLPGVMADHREHFFGVAGPGSPAVKVWQFSHNDTVVYAILAGVDDRAYVHLFNANGAWLAHAVASFDGRFISDLRWGVQDLVDHTVCFCDGSDMERCHWEDGSWSWGEQECD